MRKKSGRSYKAFKKARSIASIEFGDRARARRSAWSSKSKPISGFDRGMMTQVQRPKRTWDMVGNDEVERGHICLAGIGFNFM
jgi:hypothetical protein